MKTETRVNARPTLREGAWGHRSLLVLFKVRVVVLLLFAAVGGACIATGGWPDTNTLAVLLVAGGMAAGGASAINQYLEQELDARMERTQRRPLAAREFTHSRWVPYVGALMILLPSLAILPFNPALTFFLLLGAGIYIGVYTIWLKPRTPLNIVIGGAAGSAAVLSGSAAAGNWNEPGAVVLALLVFLWTPTHFWSLAIAYRDDYARGGIPMLPVQSKPRTAAVWVLLHASGAVLATLALATHPSLGWLYLVTAGLASTGLLALSALLIAQPGKKRALALFHGSNLYLGLLILVICVEAALA
ncbi:MAG: heme o synthase [Anaerolineae bacterium]